MKTIKSKKFILRPYKKGDEKSLALNINNKKIYRNTLHIPHPYTLKDAKKWISENLKQAKNKKFRDINFVIDINGEVAGGIGFHNIKEHKAEIGYWLGEKYWGQGIMTKAVKLAIKFGFEKLKLKRIYAFVFLWNKPSVRVLEKNSFKPEGVLKKNVKKDGKLLDDYLYAKIK